MEINERITAILSYYGLSVNEFVAKTGIKTKQAVYDILHGKTKSISPAMESKIISCFPEIRRSWLLTGEGDMLLAPSPPKDTIGPVMVPKYSGDSRGGPKYNQEVDTNYYVESYIPFSREIAREGDVAITIYGDSMEPVYREGSLVLIRRIDMWREYIDLGRTYVVELMDDRRMIKIVKAGSDNDHLLLSSINPAFDPQEVSKAFIRSVWMVIASVRREEL